MNNSKTNKLSSNQVQPEHQKGQSQSRPQTMLKRCMTSLESKLPLPVANLRDDLRPLMFELKTMRRREQEIPVLGAEKTLTTKVNRKMHLLQARMAIQEMILTRRARKSNRILEKYKTNQATLTKEFARLNPTQKTILSDEAKKTLSGEITQLDKKHTNRTTRRKRAKMLKGSAQAKATQPSKPESKN